MGKSVTTFKKRHSNHKCEIKTKKGGLGQHYGGQRQCSYADLSITLIGIGGGGKQKVASRQGIILAEPRLLSEFH